MRHRKRGRKLGRSPAHRGSLRRNLLRNFIRHERLTTTLAKAKEIQPHLEKLISLARTKTLPNIRRALAILGHDRELVGKLFDSIGPRFQDRPGGYTRLLKLAKPRLGDAAPQARLELVTEEMPERPAPKPTVVEEEPQAAEAEPEKTPSAEEPAESAAGEGGEEKSSEKEPESADTDE